MRVSQPALLLSAINPLPLYTIFALAIKVETTVFSGVTSLGRTIPEILTSSLPLFRVSIFSPLTSILPFECMLTTDTVILPDKLLLCVLSPLPLNAVPDVTDVDNGLPASVEALPNRVGAGMLSAVSLLELVLADFAATVFSSRIIVMRSPTRRAFRSSNKNRLVSRW